MIHWLCMNPLVQCDGEMLARFLDRLEHPWEWADFPNVHDGPSRLIVVRCESAEQLAEMLASVPDRSLMTAFGFSHEPEGGNDGI